MPEQTILPTISSPIFQTLKHNQPLKIAKVFEDNQKPITTIDFDKSGELCITSSSDESIHLYDAIQGKHKKTLFSKKYGVHLARFTHRKSTVVYASTKEDDTLRYLSVHDNKYLRYFKGHTNKVVSLEICPNADCFISAAIDDTVRVWDLRQPNSTAKITISGRPCIAYDREGLVFAVGIAQTIRLYDVKNSEKGPFSTFIIPQDIEAIGLEFSADGKLLLISTLNETLIIMDAFTGDVKKLLTGYVGGSQMTGLESCFTPDGNYILCGSQDGNIHIWETKTGLPIPHTPLEDHTSPVTALKFNPNYMMMASAGTSLAFWLAPIEDYVNVDPDYEKRTLPASN